MESVKLEKQGHVGIVTIDRQEALNILDSQVPSDLDVVTDQTAADGEICVMTLTGTGRSSMMGADISGMKGFSSIDGRKFDMHGGGVFLKLENLSKPVTAAVNGFVLGGGYELSMACDIRLASEKARFGQPEVGLGITPSFDGIQQLPRTAGISKAMELILTVKTIGADEVKAIGLVSEVYPAEELMDKAVELANTTCINAQIAVCESKRYIRMGMQTDIHTGSAFEAKALGVTRGTKDKNEGMGAFLEKQTGKHSQNR